MSAEDEAAAKLLASVWAQRLLLGKLYAMVYATAGLTHEQIRAMHRQIRESLSGQALVRSSDPAISDAYLDEVAAEIKQFLEGVEAATGVAEPEPPKAPRTRRRS